MRDSTMAQISTLSATGLASEADGFSHALVGSINHERMPVLLTEEAEFEPWLTGSTKEAMRLVESYDPARMRMVQSGSAKEDQLIAGTVAQATSVARSSLHITSCSPCR